MKEFVFAAMTGGSVLIAAAAAPIDLPWHLAAGLCIAIATFGATFEFYTDENRDSRSSLIARVGLSAIAAFTFFSLIRLKLEDSLQMATLSGVAGVYGRHVLRLMAKKIFGQMGLEDGDKAKPN